jgi:hypothetical protein
MSVLLYVISLALLLAMVSVFVLRGHDPGLLIILFAMAIVALAVNSIPLALIINFYTFRKTFITDRKQPWQIKHQKLLFWLSSLPCIAAMVILAYPFSSMLESIGK